jgi:hypothetical protein
MWKYSTLSQQYLEKNEVCSRFQHSIWSKVHSETLDVRPKTWVTIRPHPEYGERLRVGVFGKARREDPDEVRVVDRHSAVVLVHELGGD